jgi:hypothetical protein
MNLTSENSFVLIIELRKVKMVRNSEALSVDLNTLIFNTRGHIRTDIGQWTVSYNYEVIVDVILLKNIDMLKKNKRRKFSGLYGL